MTTALGIHVGHDSSCALVVDGELVSAIQAERLTRTKHQSVFSLSNTLPVQAVLQVAGLEVEKIDVIVTSFQWVGPGGFGLHRHLIEPDFSLFDPWADKHRVLSHHLAHAHSAYETSPFNEAAVLICDYAGSPTSNGFDYAQTFRSWYNDLTQMRAAVAPKVECMSFYRADSSGTYRLLDRDYNVAHPGQGSFIYSIAGLYENVSRYVIGRSSAHGELMALAAFGVEFVGREFDPGILVQGMGSEEVIFRNDWQHALPTEPTFELKCCLAWRCQEATEMALVAAGRKAVRLSGSTNLVVAGGVFLNILANTRLAGSGVCTDFHVPSAPHDAGVSTGCALYGSRMLGSCPRPYITDRLGPRYTIDDMRDAIRLKSTFIDAQDLEMETMIHALNEGKLVARWSGRSEFGPRALGGRSLLASPLFSSAKDRLNKIKGREPWRPVAPVVPAEDLCTFFEGPQNSYWMTMSHLVREEHRSTLIALSHPDNSTRAQALQFAHDEELYVLLKALGSLCGYPVLVNTSLNRRSEPIIETPLQAIEMFLDKTDIDILLLGDKVITRSDPLQRLACSTLTLSSNVFVSWHRIDSQLVRAVSLNDRTWRISDRMQNVLESLANMPMPLGRALEAVGSDPIDMAQMRDLLSHGVLVPTRITAS